MILNFHNLRKNAFIPLPNNNKLSPEEDWPLKTWVEKKKILVKHNVLLPTTHLKSKSIKGPHLQLSFVNPLKLDKSKLWTIHSAPLFSILVLCKRTNEYSTCKIVGKELLIKMSFILGNNLIYFFCKCLPNQSSLMRDYWVVFSIHVLKVL